MEVNGHQLFALVLGSVDRYHDMRLVLQAVRGNYSWVPLRMPKRPTAMDRLFDAEGNRWILRADGINIDPAAMEAGAVFRGAFGRLGAWRATDFPAPSAPAIRRVDHRHASRRIGMALGQFFGCDPAPLCTVSEQFRHTIPHSLGVRYLEGTRRYMAEERLQKVLAAAGVASRRASEKLITSGRVRVEGQVVTALGTKVDPASVTVSVDGRPIRLSESNSYFRVYKPRGILSDIGGDTRGRRTVASLLPKGAGRVFPVGRLDLNSEGLVLLTDDGALANRLTHPRYEHPKTYYVLVRQRPTADALVRLREGVELESGRTAPAQVEIADGLPARLLLDKGTQSFGAAQSDGWKSSPPERGVWLRIVLREGKKRQIRHMASAVGVDLRRLIRWSIGPVTLDGLEPGMCRVLTRGEVYSLKQMVDKGSDRRSLKGRPRKGPDRSRGKRRFPPRKRG